MRGDGALSDVLGAALTLAATVALVGAVLASGPLEAAAPEPPELDFEVEARPDVASLVLRHTGGDAVPLADVLVSVSAGGEALARRAAPTSGPDPWRVGSAIVIPLDRPLRAGDALDIVLDRGDPTASVLATLRLPTGASVLPGASPGPISLEVTFRVGADYLFNYSSRVIYLEARFVNLSGRKTVEQVSADLTPLRAPPWVPLSDDGTRGDAVAGDGTYTLAYLPPPDVPLGVHNVTITALVEGTTLTGRGQVLVTSSLVERPVFDTTTMQDVGWRVEKLDKKRVLIQLKARVNTAHTSVGGLDNRLEKLRIQTTLDSKTDDLRVKCDDGTIAAFEYQGDLRRYQPLSDVLQYYFQIEWRPNSGVSKTYATIEAAPPLLYFSLRASEMERDWGFEWRSYEDCTPDVR